MMDENEQYYKDLFKRGVEISEQLDDMISKMNILYDIVGCKVYEDPEKFAQDFVQAELPLGDMEVRIRYKYRMSVSTVLNLLHDLKDHSDKVILDAVKEVVRGSDDDKP